MTANPTAKSARSARLASSEPSRFLHQHVSILDAGLPVLDAPCGFGRNSLFLARRGYGIIGADLDRERVGFLRGRAEDDPSVRGNLSLVICDLKGESLPFQDGIFGTLLIIHFIPRHWKRYLALLRTGGVLLFETMGGQGGNYLQLPAKGEIQALLEQTFGISVYQERPAGPTAGNTVTVRLVARKL